MISDAHSGLFARLFLALLFVMGMCTALNAQSQLNEMELLDNQRVLRVGDRMWFRVIEEREQRIPVFVNQEGYVDVPYINDVYAVGKTPRELAYDVKALLEVDFFYNATVIIELRVGDNVRGEITILGEVGKPGKVNIPADEIMYVSDSILRAGNFTSEADGRSVTVVRQDPENPDAEIRFIVDVEGILQTGRYEYDMPVQPDDLIIVPKLVNAGGQVYITGEVKSPGLYPIPGDQEFTVSRAILAAGGFTEWARKEKVKLIRAGDDMSPEERTLIVNVDEILNENIRSFDPLVKPGDVIRVEESFIKF